MNTEYHLLTVSDLMEAINYYDNQRSGLGNEFRMEVYDAIERIQTNPYIYPEVKGVRRALVRRFPYSIIYRIITENCIRILVIRHHKRDPTYGSFRR